MNILFDLSGCNQPYNAITVYGLRILAGFKENGYKDISILCDARIYDHVHVTFPEYSLFGNRFWYGEESYDSFCGISDIGRTL
mgnify:CR=1 FL=1